MNRLAGIKIFDRTTDLGTGIPATFFLRRLQKIVMISEIWRLRENTENIRAGVFLNDIGHVLRVAQTLAVYFHIAVIPVIGNGEIDDKGFRVRIFRGVCSLRRSSLTVICRCRLAAVRRGRQAISRGL